MVVHGEIWGGGSTERVSAHWWLEFAAAFFGIDGEYWRGGETDESGLVEWARPRGRKEREEEERSGCGKVGS